MPPAAVEVPALARFRQISVDGVGAADFEFATVSCVPHVDAFAVGQPSGPQDAHRGVFAVRPRVDQPEVGSVASHRHTAGQLLRHAVRVQAVEVVGHDRSGGERVFAVDVFANFRLAHFCRALIQDRREPAHDLRRQQVIPVGQVVGSEEETAARPTYGVVERHARQSEVVEDADVQLQVHVQHFAHGFVKRNHVAHLVHFEEVFQSAAAVSVPHLAHHPVVGPTPIGARALFQRVFSSQGGAKVLVGGHAFSS